MNILLGCLAMYKSNRINPEMRACVDAVRIGEGDAGRVVGMSLKALRQASGISQSKLAERLGVGQAAISEIEQRGDVQVSSLHPYVEALGARLRIDASFPGDSSLSKSSLDALGGRQDDRDQYILPIFGNEPKPRRDLVLSIKPEFSRKILVGRKTVELRRRFPLGAARGTVAYIYSTSPVRALVGAAEINCVERLPISILWQLHGDSAAISMPDFEAYFKGLDEGYALTIARPRSFTRAINLAELRDRFGFKAPQSFLYAKPNLQRALDDEPSDISD